MGVAAPLPRRIVAEALGTALLVATVVGSGIMAEKLAGGNQAIALLGNTIPTGAILVVLITDSGPGVGRAFQSGRDAGVCARDGDPVGRCAAVRRGAMRRRHRRDVLAHLMFDLVPLMIGTTVRSGPSQWLAEAVATFSLLLAILGGVRYAPQAVPWLVGLVITAAYWFTASTSFANPAVTLARGFTTTFAGIAINHVPAFIVAQLTGAALGALVAASLFGSARTRAGA